MNAKIKVVRDAIGLTENKSYLKRWLISAPEIAHILDEFEGTLNITSSEVQEHHNSTISSQTIF